MITTISNDNCFQFRGLSSDTKPIGKNVKENNVDYPISNGSVFFEMDTGNVFMFSIEQDGDEFTGTWLEI